jgi:hypothetical protein
MVTEDKGDDSDSDIRDGIIGALFLATILWLLIEGVLTLVNFHPGSSIARFSVIAIIIGLLILINIIDEHTEFINNRDRQTASQSSAGTETVTRTTIADSQQEPIPIKQQSLNGLNDAFASVEYPVVASNIN